MNSTTTSDVLHPNNTSTSPGVKSKPSGVDGLVTGPICCDTEMVDGLLPIATTVEVFDIGPTTSKQISIMVLPSCAVNGVAPALGSSQINPSNPAPV